MAAVMVNAAAMAYRKAASNTRRASMVNPETPGWMKHFARYLEVDDSAHASNEVIVESTNHRKERLFAQSDSKLERLAWNIHIHITSKLWFELFVMVNIVAVGITTGVDLENLGRDQWTVDMSEVVANLTLAVFTLECFLKILSEAYEPWRYFTDPEFGNFNIFDFLIVFFSYVFIETGGGAISALRMLRLIRLLTFIKFVPELRVLIGGLTQGVKSVFYICMLLFLVIYIFAILGCLLFGQNDPNHFGDVSIAMLTLFQISTQASWTSIAYVSWFGCETYLGSPYSTEEEQTSRIRTHGGSFEGFKCDVDRQATALTGFFFALYILITSWVIMSLFIGVISMGMFETYIALHEDERLKSYVKHHAENTMSEATAKAFYKGREELTLKHKIDLVLDTHAFDHLKKKTFYTSYVQPIVLRVRKVRDSTWFTMLVTFTILMVGGYTGIDTNKGLKCERMLTRFQSDDNDADTLEQKQDKEYDNCLSPTKDALFVALISQFVFTCEALIKISAEGLKPWRYFTDKENGSWNCVDFFIVVVGFMEYTTASFIFENFPVVLLRLLRLLRVFRLAKTLPRLRSIVEALVSGFSSVGWICVLFAVFNYITACMCIIIFRENDPFHFGSVGRSMFTIFRIETLDTWDQILYIAMFGCEKYPAGYDFLDISRHPKTQCLESKSYSFGWLGALILFIITIVGAYILPVVLIGVVSIKFDHAKKFIDVLAEHKKELATALRGAEEVAPGFFTEERVELLEDVFATLDSSGQKNLDMHEAAPFFQYCLAKMFKVELTPKEYESLGMVVDANLTSEIGMGEFVTFLGVLKKMEIRALHDDEFSERVFNRILNKQQQQQQKQQSKESNSHSVSSVISNQNVNSTCQAQHQIVSSIYPTNKNSSSGYETKEEDKGISSKSHNNDDGDFGAQLNRSLRSSSKSFNEGSIWDKAMLQVNQEVLQSGWDAILRAVNGVEVEPSDSNKDIIINKNSLFAEKIKIMFKNVDSDGTGDLDIQELGKGLEACEIFLSEKQVNALANSMDVDGDGSITLEEFALQIQAMKLHRENQIDQEDQEKMIKAILKSELKRERNECLLAKALLEKEILQDDGKVDISTQATINSQNDDLKSTNSGKKSLSKSASFLFEETRKSRGDKLLEIRELVEKRAAMKKNISTIKQEIKELDYHQPEALTGLIKTSSRSLSLKNFSTDQTIGTSI